MVLNRGLLRRMSLSDKPRRISMMVKNEEHKDVSKYMNLSGYEDLKKYCHKNNDFLRDVAVLFLERAKLEQSFADGLAKFASKAKKICSDAAIGSLKTSWEEVSSQTEEESLIHKNLSNDIIEDIIKPLKILADTQKETRKASELSVEKAAKRLSEKRMKETQSKKMSYLKAKESESLTVQVENTRGKTLTDKDLSKLDTKCKKAEEGVVKADDDYITRLVASERARLTLDSSITSAAQVFEKIEEDRIKYFKETLQSYTSLLNDNVSKFSQCYDSAAQSVNNITVADDMQLLISTRGTKRMPGEQNVFTCYEEDFSHPMDATRRKLALESKIQRLQTCLIGEKKAGKGLSRLNSVYVDTPSFSNETAQQDVSHQIYHANSVISLLEVSVYRLGVTLSKINHQTPPSHTLSSYLTETKDKQGMCSCVLAVPLDKTVDWTDNGDQEDEYTPASAYIPSYDSYNADGASDDEFDDVDADFEDLPPTYSKIDVCVADFEYVGQEADELTISPGDQINILLRHDDGWWKGELRGKSGLFPASYVHEV